jgi:hypothetical protein
MPHHSYFLYKYPLLRLVNPSLAERLIDIFVKVRKIPPSPGNISSLLKNRDYRSLQSIDIELLIKKVQKISRRKYKTHWEKYHDEFYDEGGRFISDPRFERIIDIMKDYDIGSVLELGGNQGVFSRLLMERMDVKKVICTDYDANAIDILYINSKKNKLKIVPAVLDFMFPTMNYYDPPSHKRFKSDAVMVLAVTHHLSLSQHLPIDLIFKVIALYSRRYVFIEFMPLGLHDGKKAPQIPPWYTFDWFKQSFEKYFNILLVEKLDENRILFVGELINR